MNIGDYDVSLLDSGRFRLDGGGMFGIVPRTLWQRQIAPDDQNRIQMSTNLMLIRDNRRNILVDTGLGDKGDAKFQKMYAVDHSEYNLPKALADEGISPLEITDVILTHLHFDHAGGATIRNAEGGLQPAFPNAAYYVQRRHYEWALQASEKDRRSFLKADFLPLWECGQLHLLDGETMLFPGIEVLIVDGHTVGQQMVLIHGKAQSVFIAADLLPTAAHVSLPWVMAYDLFPLTTIEEKKGYLQRASEEQWLVVFAHDPVTPCATVHFDGTGFRMSRSSLPE